MKRLFTSIGESFLSLAKFDGDGFPLPSAVKMMRDVPKLGAQPHGEEAGVF